MAATTVKDLKELLASLPPEADDHLVILSKDSEGNSFSPMPIEGGFSIAHYRAVTSWYGEIGPDKMTPELRKQGYTKDDLVKDGVPALVLWPTN